MGAPPVVVAGFREDASIVLSQLEGLENRCRVIDEDADEMAVDLYPRMVVYVFSKTAGYSSQLYAKFGWLHYRSKPQEEYVLRVKEVDLSRAVFPILREVPEITVGWLQRRLRDL